MASEKRCHYEVLGLRRECTADEIRSAYKKLALQRHPDKLIQAGVPEAEATASFQELLNAYETLSDPKERGWYDSHRSKILFSSPDSSNSTVPNLFSYFSNSAFSGFSDTGRGFYAVYRDVFNKIYSSEVNFVKKLGLRSGIVKEAPLMGNLESPYSQVQAFYNYWLGFCTVMDFCWVDQYDVMSGTNRKSRRVMEEDNGKLRKKAKKEYNETVRGLASFVKRRDKRVIDMQVKKSREMERKKEEEMRKRKEIERERLERAKAYKEPEWATIEEVDFEEEGMEDVEEQKKDIKELYCMVCGKKFKSEKQWKNHEQSKKHREKVAELKGALKDDFQEYEVEEKFRNNFSVRGEKDDDSTHESGKDGNEDDADFVGNGDDIEGVIESVNSDDETSVLKAMLSGQKNKENATSFQVPEATSMGDEANIDGEEVGFMAYDNRKGNRRKMKGKRNKGKTVELREVDINETSGQDGQNNELDNLEIGNCFSNDLEGKDNSLRASDQPIDRKGYVKNGEHVKPRNVSKKNSYKVQAVQKYFSSSPPQDAECLSLVLRRAYRPELGRVSYNFCPEVVVLLVCVTMFCIYASYDGGLGFFFQI